MHTHLRAIALPLLVFLLSALTARAGDRLLVGSYLSDSVTRHDAATGAFQDALAPGVLDGVLGLAIAPDGTVLVCSELSNSILRFDAASGSYLGTFVADDPATPADETGGLNKPSGIVFGADGDAYVASFDGDSVLRYDGASGGFLGTFVTTASNNLNGPDAGLAFGPGGDLFVPGYWNNAIKRYSATNGAPLGNFVVPLGTGLSRPRMIRFHGAFAYVVSEGNDRVIEVDAATGAFSRNLCVDDPATIGIDESGGLDAPSAIAFGPDGRLYVASLATNQVLRYDLATGHFVDVFVAAGAGGIQGPTFLAFRPDAISYGTTSPNSAGAGAYLEAEGFTSLATAELSLPVHGAPPFASGRFLYSAAAGQVPFGAGTLWIERTSARALGVSALDAFGHGELAIDFAAVAQSPLTFVPGGSRMFQLLYRDGAAGPWNLSQALEITFSP